MLLFRDVGTFNPVLRMIKNERTAFGRNHPGPFREWREDGERSTNALELSTLTHKTPIPGKLLAFITFHLIVMLKRFADWFGEIKRRHTHPL